MCIRDSTYWVFNDSQREAYEKNIQLINDQIRALEQEANVAKKNWDFARYAQPVSYTHLRSMITTEEIATKVYAMLQASEVKNFISGVID